MYFSALRFCLVVACLGGAACSGGGGSSSVGNVVPGGDRAAKVEFEAQAVAASAATDGNSGELLTVGMTVSNMPADGVYAGVEYTRNGIDYADVVPYSDTAAEVQIQLRNSGTLAAGTYSDVVTVVICYDAECDRHVTGSPAQISVTYTVTAPSGGGGGGGGGGTGPTPDTPPALPFASSAALPHDVIDAEYSNALDAVVMVSAYPSSALHLYDVSTGTEQSVALNKVPSSVSVSPDGLSAAVGHDALVTVVSLQNLGTPAATAPVLLNVSAPVLDVVLAGNGYVYAFPSEDQWASIHALEIASNTETLSSYATIYAGTLARLHPSGTAIYGADNGLSPSDIEKYDISTGPVSSSYDSPYHGDYAMCGNLWFSENGVSIYTACGNVFRSSPVQAQDMVYNGQLDLSTNSTYGYRIVHLSQSAEASEIVLIEEEACFGGTAEQCRSRVGIYESLFLNKVATYSLPLADVGGGTYLQKGRFIFHNAAGTQKFLVSQVIGMPNPDTEFYFNVLQ